MNLSIVELEVGSMNMNASKSGKNSISALKDETRYTIFLIGNGPYEGVYRVDNTTGAEIKHNHLIFEVYDQAEIYQNSYSPGSNLYRAAENTILHKIEHAIKEIYYRREGLEQLGLKGDINFHILRTTADGHYLESQLSGKRLSKKMKMLMHDSKTITFLEKDSRAERVLLKTIRSDGKVKIHTEETYFSDLTPEEQAKYQIGDDYKTDPFASQNNVIEHHQE